LYFSSKKPHIKSEWQWFKGFFVPLVVHQMHLA